MPDYALARVLHVLGIVMWIGGVAMVTTVILPAVRHLTAPEDRIATFESIEHRFAWQARVTTLVTGISGFYLTHRLDAWDRFGEVAYWWMPAMVGIWLVFTLILFLLEPPPYKSSNEIVRLLHVFSTPLQFWLSVSGPLQVLP